MDNLTYSALLTQILQAENKKCQDLYEVVIKYEKDYNLNIQISYPALAAYKNYSIVPTFEKASLILKAVGYSISTTDLSKILEYSRQELKRMKSEGQNDIRQGVRINPKKMGLSINVSELELLIKRRINELYDKDESFNSYVNDLIKNDLIQSGYINQE